MSPGETDWLDAAYEERYDLGDDPLSSGYVPSMYESEPDPGLDTEECIDWREDAEPASECGGNVEYRVPLSGTGEAFPRCERHWEIRLALDEEIRSNYPDSPCAPDWFDPANAGESWDGE